MLISACISWQVTGDEVLGVARKAVQIQLWTARKAECKHTLYSSIKYSEPISNISSLDDCSSTTKPVVFICEHLTYGRIGG